MDWVTRIHRFLPKGVLLELIRIDALSKFTCERVASVYIER